MKAITYAPTSPQVNSESVPVTHLARLLQQHQPRAEDGHHLVENRRTGGQVDRRTGEQEDRGSRGRVCLRRNTPRTPGQLMCREGQEEKEEELR